MSGRIQIFCLFLFQTFFAESKEKLINNALQALTADESEPSNITVKELEAQFHALRRLFASKIGFSAFTMLPGYEKSFKSI